MELFTLGMLFTMFLAYVQFQAIKKGGILMLETVLVIALSPIAIICGIFSCALVYGMVAGVAQVFKKKRK